MSTGFREICWRSSNWGLQATSPSQGGWGIGQQQPKTNAYLPWERGRETSAFEMGSAPFPTTAPERVLNPKVADTCGFSQQPKAPRGRGERTISNAEVSFPPPLVRFLLSKGSDCPNPSISLAGGTSNRPINPNLKYSSQKNNKTTLPFRTEWFYVDENRISRSAP